MSDQREERNGILEVLNRFVGKKAEKSYVMF